MKDSGALSSGPLACNVAHCIDRCHFASSYCPVNTGGKEMTARKCDPMVTAIAMGEKALSL